MNYIDGEALSQCTYRCVVLPDGQRHRRRRQVDGSLNAPTGAWCSLTLNSASQELIGEQSQCTYRCVVLPDSRRSMPNTRGVSRSQCTYRCVVLPDARKEDLKRKLQKSQCTYRCVVLPDCTITDVVNNSPAVSMHLQVRGAP